MKFKHIVLRLLIECLRMLMDIKQNQTGSNYSFHSQTNAIREAENFIKNGGSDGQRN